MKYRIVKWSPVLPAIRQPVEGEVFTDLAHAEQAKNKLQKSLPYRCFGVEPIKTDKSIGDSR
jgi:hypothetical protein